LKEAKIKQLCQNIQFFIDRFYEPMPTNGAGEENDSAWYIGGKIQQLSENMEKTFAQQVMDIIKERNLNEVEVYKKAGLDRKIFSKLRVNKDYRPSKETAVLLCLALNLNFGEAAGLLHSAGYSLSRSILGDVITEYFLKEGIYDVFLYREVLFRFGVIK